VSRIALRRDRARSGATTSTPPAGLTERRYSDRQIYRRVFGEARPHWGKIAVIFALSLLATPLALLTPLPLKIAVDGAVGNKPLPSFLSGLVPNGIEDSKQWVLIFAACLLVFVEVASQLQSLGLSLLQTYTGERLTLLFRAALFRHVQGLSLVFHDRRGTADSNYRIQYDAASIQTIAINGVIPFVAAGLTVASMLYVTARVDVLLVGVALIFTPILLVLTSAYRRRLRVRQREVKKLESSALSVVQEVLTSLRIVKAFGQEAREEERFVSRAGEGMQARVRVALIDGTFGLLIGVATALGTAAVLYIGIRRVQSGTITLGSLLLVMGYLTQLYGPLATMSRRITSLQSAFASAERVFGLLEEAPDVEERPDARPLPRARGAVELREVTFWYEPGRPVLDRVSFAVAPGERVGLAGRTGAGKTTLVGLLSRFYDPREGAIFLDGVDLRDYKVADLRNQFAIVLQEPVLFSTTIWENIAYGRPEARHPEVEAAAKAADIHDFIKQLPDGYDTTVGERGMSLSGGERQRISLARAFLKDAPILILDEPTSSVDTKTEATIIEAMERLMAGRTAFMIAHRLSTLEGCSLRLEVENGRVRAPSPRDDHQTLTGART
jgi:ATP-binding cassette subfamily B protein